MSERASLWRLFLLRLFPKRIPTLPEYCAECCSPLRFVWCPVRGEMVCAECLNEPDLADQVIANRARARIAYASAKQRIAARLATTQPQEDQG